MKVVYEPAYIKLKYEDKIVEILSSKDWFVSTTIQYKKVLEKLKSSNKGIVLGCNVSVLSDFGGKEIVFLGDGRFHAIMIKKSYPDKTVYLLNPFNLKIKEMTYDDVKSFVVKETIAKDKLLNCSSVGIIVSIKFGQNRMKQAIELKKRLSEIGKKVYLFLFDTIDISQFMNFKGIDVLVNTACPRLALDDYNKFPVPIVNISELDDILKQN